MPDKTMPARAFVFFGGLFGFCGIALAAAAAHLDGERLLGGASAICLAHAPALLALGLSYGKLKTGLPAGLLLIAGSLLFAGDLITRHFFSVGLFSMAAPTGGMLMMAGWLVAALGAFIRA